jgi:Electron transfer DM13
MATTPAPVLPPRLRGQILLTLGANIGCFVAVAAVVLIGVWVAGGVVTDDFYVAAVLTGVWFVLSGAVALGLARRLRRLRVGVGIVGGYAVTAAAVSAYLGISMFNDRVVDERVVVGTPVMRMEAPAPGMAEEPPSGPVELASARFRSHEHETRGTAAVVRLPDGRRMLTMRSFSTSAGPDLRVRIVPGSGHDGGVSGAVDLGALKGNRGDQQYRIPADVTLRTATVVIWCRAFSAPFGSATVRADDARGEDRTP